MKAASLFARGFFRALLCIYPPTHKPTDSFVTFSWEGRHRAQASVTGRVGHTILVFPPRWFARAHQRPSRDSVGSIGTSFAREGEGLWKTLSKYVRAAKNQPKTTIPMPLPHPMQLEVALWIVA